MLGPYDVWLLHDLIILAMQLASKTWGVFNLGVHDIVDWRQLKHVIISLENDFIEINTSKNREKNGLKILFDLLLLDLDVCLGLIKFKELDPTSNKTPSLETMIGSSICW